MQTNFHDPKRNNLHQFGCHKSDIDLVLKLFCLRLVVTQTVWIKVTSDKRLLST